MLEKRFEIGVRAGATAENVQTERSVFGKSVAGDVRFRKQAHSGDAAGVGELMPLGFAERMQIELADECTEEGFQRALISERGWIAAVCFNDPFETAHVC